MKPRPSDEEIARALRAHAREEEGSKHDDARWAALARGEASADEIDELSRLAEEEEMAREALALFEPVGEGAQKRYAEAITAELGRGATGSDAVGVTRADPASKRRVMRWIAPVSMVVAVAAAVALMVVRGPSGGASSELPGYALTFSGGEATSRGAPSDAAPVLDEGSRFTIALRPATAVTGPLGARVFLVQGDRVEAIEAEIKVSSTGAVLVSARLGTPLRAQPGDAEIVAVVARPEALPSQLADAASLGVAGGRIARQRVRIAGKR